MKLNARLVATKRVYEDKEGKKHDTTDFKLYDASGNFYILIKPVFAKGGYYQQLAMMASNVGVENADK